MSRLFGVLFFCLTFLTQSFSQPGEPVEETWVRVDQIEVKGNEKTKRKLIIRELNFEIGDSILLTELQDVLSFNRLQLMNTGLFTDVGFNIPEWDDHYNITLLVDVTEAWYFYPIPVFELADRNFNVWWVDYERSLKRINYGLDLFYFNMTGRGDEIEALIQLGFTQKFELDYSIPYINKQQTLGLTANALFTRNREINYATLEDRQTFFRSEENFLLKRFRAGLGLSYRPRYRNFHEWNLFYHRNDIREEVLKELNPDFFLGALTQRYFAFSYQWSLDYRDIRPYPMNGFWLQINLLKQGFGLFDDLNTLYLTVSHDQYLPLSAKWSLAWNAKGRYAFLRDKIPFYNSKALGYFEDYIRGYEYYVIDGLDYFYLKNNVRWQLMDRTINFGRLMPLEGFKKMPTRLFLTVFSDFGRVNNPHYRSDNQLPSSWLVGYGLGLNLIVYYDKVFRLEYSRNSLGEGGIFLHWDLRY